MTWRSGLRRLPLLLVATAAMLLGAGCRKSLPPDTDVLREASRRPDVLVVVHSWTGRTAQVGRAFADMLGSGYVRFGDGPDSMAPTEAPSLDEAAEQIRLEGVKTLLLGFPVWELGASQPMQECVGTVRLEGITVVPFFTYYHGYEQERLDRFYRVLRERGAEVLPAMRFPVGTLFTEADILHRAQRALVARTDVWQGEEATPAAADCGPGEGHQGELCRVPAGPVWLGDGGPADALGAWLPPRLHPVDAFRIQAREVTVGEYRQCVADGECPEQDEDRSTCTQLNREENLPAVCIWVDAAEDYCRWAGLRLPTEAEWMRAGRGTALHRFPWGDAFPATELPLANLGEKAENALSAYGPVPSDMTWVGDGVPGLSKGCAMAPDVSPWGICDLAGNLSEWVTASPQGAEVEYRLKGGNWLDFEAAGIRLAASRTLPANARVDRGCYTCGFRCAGD